MRSILEICAGEHVEGVVDALGTFTCCSPERFVVVSLIVVVPSSARAALSACSSRSIRCLLTNPVYTNEPRYI